MAQTRNSKKPVVREALNEPGAKTSTRTTRSSNTAPSTTSSRPKRKAAQEPHQKDEAPARGKGRKRAKQETPSYLLRVDAENDPNHNTHLLRLPRELFDEITSWLPPDALTCLTLTCKAILSIIGTSPWAACHVKRAPRPRRSPSQFCGNCCTLHPPLNKPSEHRITRLTKHCLGQWSTIDYLPSDDHGQYGLVYDHVLEARKSLSPKPTAEPGPPIELLDGNFTVPHKRLNYTLVSSGRQRGKSLVLKYEHIFHSPNPRSPLKIADIIALPVRICPHQTTSTAVPEKGRHTESHLPSGLLCTSISAALPSSLRASIPAPGKFSTPTPTEKEQMDASPSVWTCRACPTKWRVQYGGQGAGELKITAWHNLGDTEYRAQKYWKMLVRREVLNLSAGKRNSEFYVTNRQYLDFPINDE